MSSQHKKYAPKRDASVYTTPRSWASVKALEPEDPDKRTQSPENKKNDDKTEKRQKPLANEKGNHDIGGKKRKSKVP